MGTQAIFLLLSGSLVAASTTTEQRSQERQERGMWENLYKGSGRRQDDLPSSDEGRSYAITDFGGFWSKVGSGLQNRASPSAAGPRATFSESSHSAMDRAGSGPVASENLATKRLSGFGNHGDKNSKTIGGGGARETAGGFLERLKERRHNFLGTNLCVCVCVSLSLVAKKPDCFFCVKCIS
jgi:hypothetical protein